MLSSRPITKVTLSNIQTSIDLPTTTTLPVDHHLPLMESRYLPVQHTKAKNQKYQPYTPHAPNGKIGTRITYSPSPLIKRPVKITVTKLQQPSLSTDDGENSGVPQCKKHAVQETNLTTPSNIVNSVNRVTRQPQWIQSNILTTSSFTLKKDTTKESNNGTLSSRPCSDYTQKNDAADSTSASGDTSMTYSSKRKYHSQKIKNQLADIMNEHDIFCNERYNRVLATNVNLQKLELLFNPLQLNHLKAQLFNQITIQRENKTWIDRVATITSMEDKYKYLAIKLVLSIANENHISIEKLSWLIVSILNNEFHKKKTLVLHGLTNSGKTTFSEMLLSPFYPYEIGCFSSPASQGQNNFWLMALIGKSVYRSEELVMENYQCLQQFKMLAEGNQLLETEVKYQTNQKLPSKPVVVTTNAESPERFCLFFSDECQAVKNRTIWIKMSQHLYTRLPEKNLVYIPQITTILPTILIHFYNKYKETIEVNNNDVDIEEDILNLM